MKHPHERIIIAFAQDTSVEIEGTKDEYEPRCWARAYIMDVMQRNFHEFRLKPAMRSITLADGTVVSWPEPMRVAPAEGTRYWMVDTHKVYWCTWREECGTDVKECLKSGFCHLTEEAAQQHRKAIVLANGGEL